jgi:hypothetical protein
MRASYLLTRAGNWKENDNQILTSYFLPHISDYRFTFGELLRKSLRGRRFAPFRIADCGLLIADFGLRSN